LHDFWLYVVGPLVGAPLGALAYEFVRGERLQPPTLGTEPGPAAEKPVEVH
jgi:hypothetical protein